eukprot:scaffold71014_cov32-Tisochrysis_lutea.AAC.6
MPAAPSFASSLFANFISGGCEAVSVAMIDVGYTRAGPAHGGKALKLGKAIVARLASSSVRWLVVRNTAYARSTMPLQRRPARGAPTLDTSGQPRDGHSIRQRALPNGATPSLGVCGAIRLDTARQSQSGARRGLHRSSVRGEQRVDRIHAHLPFV